MTYTREDLVNEALYKIGAKGTGQAADPEDYTKVDDTVQSVMSDLAKREIYQWGDPDQIDDEAFDYLAEILGQRNARIGGLLPDQNVIAIAEGKLRAQSLTFLSGQPQTTEYY